MQIFKIITLYAMFQLSMFNNKKTLLSKFLSIIKAIFNFLPFGRRRLKFVALKVSKINNLILVSRSEIRLL